MDRQTRRFFVLTFAWTWIWHAPFVLGLRGPASLVLLGLAAIGPSLAAIVVTRGAILRELRWRGPLTWIVLALFIPVALRGLALGVGLVAGQPMPDVLLVVPALGGILVPPLGEELGWRGLAYRRMADRGGRVRAGLITGLAWALWHIPLSLALGSTWSQVLSYVVMVTAGGVWMAWLYERSGRSISVSIAAHIAINAGLFAIISGPALALVGVCLAVVTGRDLARTGQRSAS